MVACSFKKVLLIEPGRCIDHRACRRGCRTAEDRVQGWLLLEHFALHRRMASWRHVSLLLASTRGNEAEDHKGDDRHDQDVEELHTLEAAAHEHGGQQAASREASQRAEPA